MLCWQKKSFGVAHGVASGSGSQEKKKIGSKQKAQTHRALTFSFVCLFDFDNFDFCFGGFCFYERFSFLFFFCVFYI